MARQTRSSDWQVFVLIGMADFALGVGLLLAGLTGFLGENGLLLAGIGGIMAVIGAGVAVWARNKMSQGHGPGAET